MEIIVYSAAVNLYQTAACMKYRITNKAIPLINIDNQLDATVTVY
jgi:hypothetical protein